MITAHDGNDREVVARAKGYIEQLYLCYALNLKPTEEERNTIITNYMKSIGYTLSVEEFIKAYGESFVDNYVVTEFALSYVDKTITIDENN